MQFQLEDTQDLHPVKIHDLEDDKIPSDTTADFDDNTNVRITKEHNGASNTTKNSCTYMHVLVCLALVVLLFVIVGGIILIVLVNQRTNTTPTPIKPPPPPPVNPPPATPIYRTVPFNGFYVVFDTANSRSVNSTICARSDSSKSCDWKDSELSNIKVADYKEFTSRGKIHCSNNCKLTALHMGHLSPAADLGSPSCTTLNVILQYGCHNTGLWREFEEYIRDTYSSYNITTTAKYDDPSSYRLTNAGKRIYIPTRLCKTIHGKGTYCIPHNCETCYKKWCCVVVPPLLGSTCVNTRPNCVNGCKP